MNRLTVILTVILGLACLMTASLAVASPRDDFDKGMAAYRANHLDEAAADFRKAADANPKDERYQSWLGYVLVVQRKYADALVPLQKASELDPRDADVWTNLGTVYMYIVEKDRAIAAYKSAVDIAPTSPKYLYNLGNAYLSVGKFAEAETWLRKALAASPDDPNIYINLGLALQRQGKTDEAIAVWRQGLEKDPGNYSLLLNLGMAYKSQNNAAAADTLSKAAKAGDGTYSTHAGLGEIYAGQGKTDEAIAEYKAASQANPTEFVPHYNLGVLYEKQAKYEDASDEYQKALRIKPTDPDTMNELGWCLFKSGQYEAGIAELKAAVQEHPNSPQIRQRLAQVYTSYAGQAPNAQKPGMRKNAIAEWQAYLKQVNDGDAAATLTLANLYMQQGEKDRAAGAYRQAIELDPKTPQARLALGYMLMEKSQYDSAIAEFKNVVASPQSSTKLLAAAHNDLGVAYEAKSRRTSDAERSKLLKLAREHYKQAYDLDGSLTDARYNLERIPEF